MHIPDAVLAPPVIVATYAAGAAGFGFGLSRLKNRLRDRTTVLMGTVSAFVFAAQMVNFPLGPLPISGHLLGGVLAAVMLGPWGGAVVIGTVLIVQCLLFQDGGVSALGANFLNMGLIGSVVGYAIYAPIRRAIGGRGGVLIGAMVAAWFSVILASAAFSVELAASGWSRQFFEVLGKMTLVHAAIGLGEALATGLVVRFVLLTRPDLIDEPQPDQSSRLGHWGQVALSGLAIAVAVAVFLAPFASSSADGLEWVGGRLGFLREAPAVVRAPIPDYQMPISGLAEPMAVALAGLVGTVVVFGTGLALARVFSRSRAVVPERVGADAA